MSDSLSVPRVRQMDRVLMRPGLADRLLVGWFAAWFALFAWHGGLAWHFFVQGQQALSDLDQPVSGGLHVYAAFPQLQIGPVALLVARVFSLFGPRAALVIAQAFGAAAGALILIMTAICAKSARPDLTSNEIAQRVRLTAVFFSPVWLYLAVRSVHLDDVLALVFAVLGTYASLRQRAVVAGLLLALAVDAKPWALPFMAVLFMLGGPRARMTALGTYAGVVAVAWLPFLIGDPHTMNAVRYTIVNTPRTALRRVGIDNPRTPVWDRPLQSLLGLLLSGVAVQRRRWPAVILVAVATRIVLDPGTNLYYQAGLVVGAALWDVTGSANSLPWWTASAALGLFLTRFLPTPATMIGWLTLMFFTASVAILVVWRPSQPYAIISRYPARGNLEGMERIE